MNMHIKRADLLKARDEKINAREKAMSDFESAAVAEKFEQKSFDAAKKAVNDIDLEIKALDEEIARVDEVRELALKSVKPAPDQTSNRSRSRLGRKRRLRQGQVASSGRRRQDARPVRWQRPCRQADRF